MIQPADEPTDPAFDPPSRGVATVDGADAPEPGRGAPVPGRLDRRELRRRFWHVLPALPVPLLWVVPHDIPLSPTSQAIIYGVAALLLVHTSVRYHLIRRTRDDRQAAPVLGYAASVLGLLLVAPDLPQLGLSVLAVLAFGDGTATLAGKLLGGPPLPWNREKTWSGLAGFLLAGTTAATLYYWGETWFNVDNPQYREIPFSTALACGSIMTFTAAVAESLPSRLNDNIRVGLAAAAAVTLAHGWLVGW